MSTIQVQDLVDNARMRHASFSERVVGDGVLLRFIESRQRAHLAAHGAAIEGLCSVSMMYTIATQNGILVALDANNVPQFATTYQDGWPIQLDVNGVPFIDIASPPIAGDPFGLHGGTPGFPLPGEMVRLIKVMLVYGSAATWIDCDLVNERQRTSWSPGRNPAAFVSGNRLVPLLTSATPANNAGGRWSDVRQLQLSYVAAQSLNALTDLIQLPAVLCDALAADLAHLLAMLSDTLDAATKAGFAKQAEQAGVAVASAGSRMLKSASSRSIVYKG